MRRRIWIDCDIALGADHGDVDDGFAVAALLAAHRVGKIDLLGISTVFGNTTASLALECARKLCLQAGLSVMTLCGAEAPGEATAASEQISRLGPDVDLLCLGPLTNIAAACRRNSQLPGHTSLMAVGGNLFSRGWWAPLWPFEFNLAKDRDAARFALSRVWRRLTLYPLDVVRQMRIGAEGLRRLVSAGSLGSHLVRHSQRWAQRARWRYLRPRFPVWDLPAALELAGTLGGTYESRRLSPAIRRLTAVSKPLNCLVSFDAAQAWQGFEGLLGDAGAAAPLR